MTTHWRVTNRSPTPEKDARVKAYVMQNDKAQDRAGSVTYQHSISGEKITVMYLIDGHGRHQDYATGIIDTGNIVATFIENVITAREDCDLANSPDDYIKYFNEPSDGVEFYQNIQKALYEHMVGVLLQHNITPSGDGSCIWTRRGRELMIVGGSTFNMALIYEVDGIPPRARVYTVGDSLIGYGDYVMDPNLDGSKLSPEIVQGLRAANIEVMYDIRRDSYSHVAEKPVYDLEGAPYPLPIRFRKGKPEAAYFTSNCRHDIAMRFTLTGVKDVKQTRYKMAPFSTMGNFGAPEVTRCPQYTDIFEVVEPLSLFSDGIGDCLEGEQLSPEELDSPSVECLCLKYPESHILSGTSRQPFKLVNTNINREMVANWDNELYIEIYRGRAVRLFGGVIDDMSFVMFNP